MKTFILLVVCFCSSASYSQNLSEEQVKRIEGTIGLTDIVFSLISWEARVVKMVMDEDPQTLELTNECIAIQRNFQEYNENELSEDLESLYEELYSEEGCGTVAEDIFSVLTFLRFAVSSITEATISDLEILKQLYLTTPEQMRVSEHLDSATRTLEHANRMARKGEEVGIRDVIKRLNKVVILGQCL